MNFYPVHVRARADAPGRWLWLVKWLLLIPHYLVLTVLWVAFVVLTVVAYVAVLFTGRYPHAIFAFNVGVLRWSWRVGYYGYQALGTDRYPPFTLAEVPDYPAGLQVEYPPRLPRWLPLVAWLLAIPHIVIVSAFTNAGSWQVSQNDNGTAAVPLSVVGALVLITAGALLFTGRYLPGLFNLLVGIARWSIRVIAYVALLTHVYPPFRLDQGENEPEPSPRDPVTTAPAAATTSAAAMSAGPTGTGPTAGMAAAAPASSAAVAGRVIALVAGVLLIGAGTGLVAGGVGVLALNAARDDGGYVSSRTLAISSPTAAITAEDLTVQAADTWTRAFSGLGTVRITATSPDGRPLFVGIAPQSDVDTWLGGTAHDQLLDAYGPQTQPGYRRATGVLRDASTPAEQPFWVAQTSGTGTVVLDWKPTDGRFAVVLANATGTQSVNAGVRLATRVPDLTPLGGGLLATGAVLIAAAFALIYFGAVGIGRRHATPPPILGPPLGPPTGPPTPTTARPVPVG
jgi:hypothetical protein